MEGNKYWEEQKLKYYSGAGEDEILKRINECRLVVEKLEGDDLWQIILRDADNSVAQLDSHWQDIYEEKQLKQMRVLKLAANQMKNMKEGYVQEWKYAKEELERRTNPDIVEKDYDAT